MNLNRYKHDDWVVYFSGGKWAPLGFSSWVGIYTRVPFAKEVKHFVTQAVMVWDGETTTCYIRESERERFGKELVQKAMEDPKYVDFISRQFSSTADGVLSIYDKKRERFNYEDYEAYNTYLLSEHYPYHIQVKNIVDFLSPELMNVYLPRLEAARVHAEPVFSKEINFIQSLADALSKKTGYEAKHLLYAFTNEITAYWRDGKKLLDEKMLKQRYEGCVIFFEDGEIKEVLVGKDIAKFSSIFLEDHSSQLRGQIAFKGKVRGAVRVVFDPLNVKEFNEGDILVAPWTRPEYLPIMKKAGAFVTDGGGILSHAAIVARELKKPCVIGTKTATQMLKDGDIVEVDANDGIVTIIE